MTKYVALICASLLASMSCAESGRPIVKGSIDQTTYIKIVDADGVTPETGVTSGTSGIDLEYTRLGGVPTDLTESDLAATNSAHSDGGIKHIGGGVYRVDLPDAACASGVNEVLVGGTITDMIVIGVRHTLCDFDIYNATPAVNVSHVGGSTTPVTNIGTVYNTDFVNNYDVTEKRWVARIGRRIKVDDDDGGGDLGTDAAPLDTINAAVAVAFPGDTIDIAAGTYAPFTVGVDRLTLFGASTAGTVVTTSSGNAGTVTGDYVTLRNMTLTTTDNTVDVEALDVQSTTGFFGEDLAINGTYDGFYAGSAKSATFRHNIIIGTYDGGNCEGATNMQFIANNSTSLGTWSASTPAGFRGLNIETAQGEFRGNLFTAVRTTSTDKTVAGVSLSTIGMARLIDNRYVSTNTHASSTGVVAGVSAPAGAPNYAFVMDGGYFEQTNLGSGLTGDIHCTGSGAKAWTHNTFIDTVVGAQAANINRSAEHLPNAVAGAANGLFIAGSNAATTVNITGDITGDVSGSVGSVEDVSNINISTPADISTEAVNTSRNFVLVPSSNGLRSEDRKTLTIGSPPNTYAADFRNDAATNQKIFTIDDVEIVSGSEGGLTFGTAYRDGGVQAKFRITAVTAGDYTVRVTVTYVGGATARGDILIKVVE